MYNARVSKIYCSNCGKLTDRTANFCTYCGAAQHGAESAVYRAQEAPLKNLTTPGDEPPTDKARITERGLEDETIAKRHLSPGAILLFFINYLGKTFIAIPILAVGSYLEPLVGLIFVAYLVVTFLIAVLVYDYFYFTIDDDEVRVEHGIIHKRLVSVPFQQIQNVNITRTLIDRLLGIARLEIESAGATNVDQREIVGGTKSRAEGFLPGVSLDDARLLHDIILQKALHSQDHR
jgi:membrane protein YdbS with pleckstrin-like domain